MRQILLLAAVTFGLIFSGNTTQAAGDDPTPNFTVNVHDAANKPISGANVSIQIGRGSQEAFTGDDGAAHLALDLAKARSVAATVKADGYAGVMKYWNKRGPTDATPDHFDVILDKDALISGRVLDQDGKPIDGAKVMVVVNKKYPGGNQRLSASFTSAAADTDGKWTFSGIPETFDNIELAAYDKNCLTSEGYFMLTKWTDLKSLRDGSAVITLKRGTPVTITVVDQDGQPLAGAKVDYGQDRVASNVLPEEKTAADGTVKLGVVSGNTAVITVLMKGYSPELLRTDIGDKPVDLKVTMKPGQILEGTVKDSAGKPVKGATIFIDTWREARTIQARIQTDISGHFTWPDAPTDEVKVDILSSKGEKRGVTMKAGDENSVTLVGPTTFKGTVVDAETGAPVTTYKIMLGIDFKQNQGSGLSWETNSGSDQIHPAGGTFDVTFSYPYPARAVRVIADDYLPCDSEEFPMQGQTIEYTFKLKHGTPIKGTIADTDGKPLPNITLALVATGQNLYVQNGRMEEWTLRGVISTQSKPDGSFTFPPQKDNYLVVAMNDQGYVEANKESIEKGVKITLKRWARIEGELREGTKPIVDASVRVSPLRFGFDENAPHFSSDEQAKTDGSGKFVLDRVMAGEATIAREKPNGNRMIQMMNQRHVTLKEGETTHVKIGGEGRPIVGHVSPPAGMAAGTYLFESGSVVDVALEHPADSSSLTVPDEVLKLPQAERSKWMENFYKTDAGQKILVATLKRQQEYTDPTQFSIEPDGSFRVPDVKAGTHAISIEITDTVAVNQWQRGSHIAFVRGKIEVPPIPNGVSDDPLDVGSFEVQPLAKKIGDVAPEVAIKTTDGKDWRLSDQKGKVTLLYFWGTYFNATGLDETAMQNLWKTESASGKFAMIGIADDYAADDADRRMLKFHPVDWPLAILTGSPSPLLEIQYQMAEPCLIGPDGKIIAVNVAGEKLQKAIEDAIKANP